jgi:hypothetical protein
LGRSSLDNSSRRNPDGGCGRSNVLKTHDVYIDNE